MSADPAPSRHAPGPTGGDAGLRVALISHGYPPRERAGTEQHVAALAEGLADRGHEVLVIAATREPAARQYAWLPTERRAPGIEVRRLVQNLPTRPLAWGERDQAVDEALAAALDSFGPDLVHVHHLQFLSSGLRARCPTVLTLHDQWLWCAAGGLGLRPDGTVCAGPQPTACASCAAAWAPRPGRGARLLLGAAGRLSPWVRPPALQRALRILPAPVRARLQRPTRGAPPEPAAAAATRNAAMAGFAASVDLCLSPSAHLAALAERHLQRPVQVLRHGVTAPMAPVPPSHRRGPVLFLGTVAHHKGVDRIVRAWRRACPEGSPRLVLHGPVADPGIALGHPVSAVLDRAGVWRALADARLLVVGSRWPENAPLVVSEARAAGCPVLAPAIGGLPELVEEGRDGWLYPPDDDDALARLLRYALDHPLERLPRPPPSPQAQLDLMLGHYRRLVAEDQP